MQDVVPRHELELPESAEVPFAVGSFATIGPLSLADFPHRHGFYELVQVAAGRGEHVVDAQSHRVHPPQVFVIVPGQVHRWKDADGVQGQVVLFTDDFLLAYPQDRAVLRRLAARSWRPRDRRQAERLTQLLAQLTDEHRRAERGRRTALQAYVHLLVVEIARSCPAGHVPAPATGAADAATERAATVAHDFAELLARSQPAPHAVRAYARSLGVSVRYLDRAVRWATGTTPTRLIRRARVLEAQRLLIGSRLSVAQIAARLDFADAAYFCRFFRRETGHTPGAFRRQAEKHHGRTTDYIDPAR